MKWLVLDACFFYLLPLLRIPWLCFNQAFTLGAIATFAALDIALCLKYNVPITAVLGGAWKLLYNRELSISERSVKWYDIVHNDSHIMGKYTVHILPEGAAKLNPDGNCFCLGPSSPTVVVPIKINGTQPINIQLTRIDLETATVEILDLSRKEIKKLFKQAPREDSSDLRLPYVVKRPGLYHLTKVQDVSELDVRVHRSEAMVVACPQATVKVPSAKKDVCKGDMSNLSVELEGLAPLSVKYTREVKGKKTALSVGRIHPENFDSPLLSGFSSDGFLAEQGDQDLAWAKRVNIPIPLNDTLSSPGDWIYEIDQVMDGCGNVVDYNTREDSDTWLPQSSAGLGHRLTVHERPLVRFHGCDPQSPMDLARGKQAALPLALSAPAGDAPYRLLLAITPFDKLSSASEHAPDPVTQEWTLKSTSLVMAKEPGLYSVRGISSLYCAGEVLEPASCLVITPPEPSMTMEHDEILDKCSGSSIGLTIDLTLVGTPPFQVAYRLIKDNGTPRIKTLHIDRVRHQVRFTPESAGHYAYEFFNLDDKNYAKVKLDPTAYRVEQTVKPLAGASFINPHIRKKSCIDEPVEFDVKMQGAAPLTLHYDLIHNGRRTRISNDNITSQIHTIKTPPLANGGEYSLTLTSVEDQTKCKVYLESEAKLSVRFQRPKAQFAPVEGNMGVRALEGKAVKIPMRLTGEGVCSIVLQRLLLLIPCSHGLLKSEISSKQQPKKSSFKMPIPT
jgi:nucleoporin POM152